VVGVTTSASAVCMCVCVCMYVHECIMYVYTGMYICVCMYVCEGIQQSRSDSRYLILFLPSAIRLYAMVRSEKQECVQYTHLFILKEIKTPAVILLVN
jgi:hypothetical protein